MASGEQKTKGPIDVVSSLGDAFGRPAHAFASRVPSIGGDRVAIRGYHFSMTSPAVRPEYEALARGFGELAAQFDFDAAPELERDMIRVCAAFEIIDRHVDETSDALRRRSLGDAIVAALRDGPVALHALGAELSRCIDDLRALLVEPPALAAFADALARFFAHTEELRTTTCTRTFVRAVHGEAECAAEMALLVCARARARLRTPRFERFFRALSDVGNLTDKLHDVRADRRRGEIAIRGGVLLHLALFASFTAHVARLLWIAPRPLRLVAWGTRYLLPPALMRATRSIEQ